MSPGRLRESIVHLAHHAAGEPELWDRVIALLAEWLHSSSVALAEHDPTARWARIGHASGIGEAFRDAYRTRFGGLNPWLRAWRGDAGEVQTGCKIVPNWELVRSEFYKVWLRPQGAFHALLGVIERRGDSACYVIALRPPDSEPFASADRNRLAALLPDLGCARDLEARVAAERRTAQVLIDLVEQIAEAVFVVDTGGRPQILNRAARSVLERGDVLSIAGGMLAAASREDSRCLHRLIEDAVGRRPEAPPRRGEIALGRGMGEPPLVLTVVPLPRPLLDGCGERPVAAIFAGPPEPAPTTPLCAFYHLTPAEARLAHLIVGGRTLLQAASALRVSRNTARTHMKRIYAKTETHRQADLVRLLAVRLPAGLVGPPSGGRTRSPLAR